MFKYVDLEHADAVAAGSTKIGTIWGFRQMEGDRRDEGENTILFDFGGKPVLRGSDPYDRALLAAMGLELHDGIELHLQGAKINYVGQDNYAYCFSRSFDSKKLSSEKPQAIFRLDDVASWINRICQIVDILGPAVVRPVEYKNRELLRFDRGYARTDPFTKPIHYIDEQEVRVIWDANPKTEMGAFPPLGLIKSDKILASLVQRVA